MLLPSAGAPFVPFIPCGIVLCLRRVKEQTKVQDLIGLPPCRVNITMGVKEDRNLITGLHTVADVYCSSCQTILGWKYVTARPTLHAKLIHLLTGSLSAYERRPQATPCVLSVHALTVRGMCVGFLQVEAFEESQKYKEGKCIIEKAKMCFDLAKYDVPTQAQIGF